MKSRIKTAFNSSVSEFSMFALLCCMISTIVPIKLNGVWSDFAVISSLAGGVILLAWLVWLIYMFVSKATVKEMSATHRHIVEWTGGLLYIYWGLAAWIESFASLWMVGLSWALFFICVLLGFKFNKNDNCGS